MDPELLERLIAVATIILVAFPVHEFSHAYAAFALGDSTARYQGRLTLNPIAHFDPIGGSLLVLSTLIGGFPIGWAKPTPVNPYNLRFGRRGDVLVALAGPLSNLAIAAVVALPLRFILADPAMAFAIGSSDMARLVLGAVEYFILINIVLMVFNLLPIPPLDGWHAVLGLVDARTAYTLRQFEQYGFIVLLLFILAGAPFLGTLVATVRRLLLGV